LSFIPEIQTLTVMMGALSCPSLSLSLYLTLIPNGSVR